MAGEAVTVTPALSDALTILGAAGIVIPAFARLRINPVLGFILVGIIAGPFALGALNTRYPWLHAVSISDPHAVEPFAEFGIIMLLFSIGLELSFRRLKAMRRQIFRIGPAELFGSALLVGGGLMAMGNSFAAALVLGVALAMSSTALVLPIAGTESPVGRAAFAMLLFEDIALVPLLFLFGTLGGGSDLAALWKVAWQGAAVIATMLIAGRYLLPPLFAQAARTKSPELFLSISLLVVIVSALATGAVGLSALMGALLAGVLIAETEYGGEVEAITAPFKGLALGVFLISVGMRLDLRMLLDRWHELLFALLLVLVAKALVTGLLLRASGAGKGIAAETGLLMSSPSETTLILLGAGTAAGVIRPDAATFWQAVTALGLTVTPLLGIVGRALARRVDRAALPTEEKSEGRVLLFGFGRVGRLVATMLQEHGRPYLAVESDIDAVKSARQDGFNVLFGDASRRELVEHLHVADARALVLTMDDPVQVVRLARQLRSAAPDLPIIARARDTAHAAQLYRAGVTDAVPETLEASLQLSEAVLVDVGLAMGPVIASIHEKRAQLRSEIMAAGELAEEPSLGRRRARDLLPTVATTER
ncbi:sodium:proton exchanger [Sphingomonas ginkgonis]|uniref:Sodium:proton exchanger n=1 Tax=Sphingomonas ginkgonis TaxID=2315330 RepID=A0A429VAU3_9SPHN|nr:cation:proton antiporter [Sphingomonas ginkgonis]RST31066.1 sodium:proton exchanger [Sphingomonas ginkgonis]